MTFGSPGITLPIHFFIPTEVDPPDRMNSQLLEEAAKVIPSQQVLINLVSRRVRQLSAGHRPLIQPGPRMGLADIAFKEIAERKITVGYTTDETVPAA